jgi:hypothetical protein
MAILATVTAVCLQFGEAKNRNAPNVLKNLIGFRIARRYNDY